MANGEELARAKINLFLHVRGQRPEGYHTLDSMVVFPNYGDIVSADPASQLGLTVDGPFGTGLSQDRSNLTLAAAHALADRLSSSPGAQLHLSKRLPVAAGIGGGSADAGAALRLLSRLWPNVNPADLHNIAFALGADAPMCLAQQPATIGGVGEQLGASPSFPEFWVVMINPNQPLLTSEVFGALKNRDNPAGPKAPHEFKTLASLTEWLLQQRNDLEGPARSIRPVIGRVLSVLNWRKDCLFARMSGSGATCFGIFATRDQAESAATEISSAEPDWWAVAAQVEAHRRIE
ncbi:MAG: 4-(cytidine 5'-diphospho)-2-C-methyl-D-erythritol kinase [Pikeienuella sp.]